MKLVQLEYFDAVCRFNSITKAAETLFVSQPAISKSLRELEREYNLTLFKRENNRLLLTEEGEFLWENSRTLLDKIKKLDSDLRALSNWKKTLRLGIPPMIGNFLFPNIFSKITSKKNPMDLSIVEFGSMKTLQLLEYDEIDIGFVILDEELLNTLSTKFNFMNIKKSELLFCISENHPLAEKNRISFDELKNIPLILMREGSFQTTKIEEEFKNLNITPNVVLYSDQTNTVKNLLKTQKVGAFFIKEFLEENDNLKSISLNPKIEIDVMMLWKKNSLRLREIKEFIKTMNLHDIENS